MTRIYTHKHTRTHTHTHTHTKPAILPPTKKNVGGQRALEMQREAILRELNGIFWYLAFFLKFAHHLLSDALTLSSPPTPDPHPLSFYAFIGRSKLQPDFRGECGCMCQYMCQHTSAYVSIRQMKREDKYMRAKSGELWLCLLMPKLWVWLRRWCACVHVDFRKDGEKRQSQRRGKWASKSTSIPLSVLPCSMGIKRLIRSPLRFPLPSLRVCVRVKQECILRTLCTCLESWMSSPITPILW